jgi:hypothetical protein
MSSPYLNDLIRIAKIDLPQLAHDLENASTIYAVQDSVKRLHNMVTYILHHIVMSDPSVAAAATAAATARAQPAPTLPPPPAGYAYARTPNGQIVLVPAQAQPQHVPMMMGPGAIGQPPAVDHYPSQRPATPPMASPNHGLPLISMAPAASPPEGQGGAPVTDVVITPRGTRVTAPTGEALLFPPGVPIDATGGAGNNLGQIPIVHDYHANPNMNPVTARPQFTTPDVVLPEGGGMTAEVAAALSRRSPEQQPLIDAAGGARVIE